MELVVVLLRQATIIARKMLYLIRLCVRAFVRLSVHISKIWIFTKGMLHSTQAVDISFTRLKSIKRLTYSEARKASNSQSIPTKAVIKAACSSPQTTEITRMISVLSQSLEFLPCLSIFKEIWTSQKRNCSQTHVFVGWWLFPLFAGGVCIIFLLSSSHNIIFIKSLPTGKRFD